MTEIRLLGICGSLRKASHNMTLLKTAQQLLPEGVSLQIADLTEVPFFSADLATKPAAVVVLLEAFQQADGFVFACPEYNYSIAPALKNALDWASREPDNRLLAGKAAAIMGAGGGMGTSRAQYHLRQVGVFLDLHFVNKPEVFVNAFSGVFAADGSLQDDKIRANIQAQLIALQALVTQCKK
ncbi:NADPH-dependent FMN reductase [Rheinheimera sp. F8]|uniref:NADPH-dependent FMN reductase n=1 Tax=Rheinheimera sp. F8 TaxID=1763998 RepID=UPI000744B437|nr:NADPH-dependent FMN reductase [Rheinheimera sp. F8]ALZ76785.1 NADPH-dependent FMN reductase [Rheinheimera sp. F8]